MIIDCHGHYTTAPKQLEEWRKRQIAALEDSKHVPAKGALGISDDDALIMFRNREATALFAWSPYMYDPKLAGRLHRIHVPTLLLWGASDRIVSPDYGRAYGALIPGAQFELIEAAGHYPHLERPDLFAQKIVDFVARAQNSGT